MQFPQRDLTNQFISTSYQDVVQRFLTGSTDYLLDGMGFVIAGIPVGSIGGTLLTQDQTASMAVSASYARLSDVAQVADVALMADTASISVESISSSYSLMADTASFIDVNNISNLYLPFQFTYKSQTSVSDPGAGNFNYDSFTSSSITRVVADILTLNGLNIKTLFSKVNQGYQLYIQQQSDATKAALFTVTGNISDNGGWLTVPVSLDSWGTGGYPTNNKSCLFAFLNSTTLATGSTYPITASWAVSASWAPPVASNFAISASWASQSLSSSVSTTASFALTAGSVLSTSSSYLSGSSGSLNILNLFPPVTSSAVIKVNALGNSTSSYLVGNGTWVNFPVPYVRGNSNTPIAFDVMPGGGGQNIASIDISDTDVVANNAVNYETLHLVKNPAGNAVIASHAGGTGTIRPLVLQDASGSIGFNTSPSEQYHAKFDQNARTTFAVENAHTGTLGQTTVEVRNKPTNTDYLRIINTGTGFATNGAFTSDGGALELGPTKSGSLSIITRTTASAIVMYQGGFSAANECLRIAAPTGRVGIGGIPNPVNALDVDGNISCSVVTASLFFGTASFALSNSATTLNTGSSYSITSSWALTSSVLRNGMFDVTNYGATGNGVTDDSTAIQNAVNAAQTAGGGTVYFPVGTFKIASTITIASASVWLLGAGKGTTILPSGSNDVFLFTNNTRMCGVEKLYFTGSVQTGGNCFSVQNSHRITFRDLYFENPYNGWFVQTCNVCTIDSVWANNVTGSYFVKWLGDDTHRSDDLSFVNINASGGSNTDGFVWDGNCQTCRVHVLGLVGFRKAITIQNSSGSTSPAFLHAHSLEVDFPNQEAIYVSTGQRYNISNAYIHGSSTANGITITGSNGGVVDHFTFMGGNITGHQKAGLANYGGTGVKLCDVQIYNNSQAGSAQYSGVECYTGGIMTIVGNIISGSNQAYGVNNTGSTTRITLNGNDLTGNVTAQYNDLAGTIVTNEIMPVRPYWADSTVYLTPQVAAISTLAMSANTLYMMPIWVTENRTFTTIALGFVSTLSTGTAHLGIYKANRLTGQPTQLIVDAGTVSVTTTGTKTASINVNLNPGMYFLAIVANGTPTVHATLINSLGTQFNGGVNVVAGLSRAFTFGALPSDESGQTYSLQNTFSPTVGIR